MMQLWILQTGAMATQVFTMESPAITAEMQTVQKHFTQMEPEDEDAEELGVEQMKMKKTLNFEQMEPEDQALIQTSEDKNTLCAVFYADADFGGAAYIEDVSASPKNVFYANTDTYSSVKVAGGCTVTIFKHYKMFTEENGGNPQKLITVDSNLSGLTYLNTSDSCDNSVSSFKCECS